MMWSLSQRSQGGRAVPRSRRHQAPRSRLRIAQLERLEDRSLLAALPFGAMPDDTGEYMLGDVYVSVVFMESTAGDPNLPPGDNGVINYPGENPITYTPENWSQWSQTALNDLKNRIREGLQWWEDTLDALPGVRDGLLQFQIDFTYADTPVPTGYEPIARKSDDVTKWSLDFLRHVGFSSSPADNPFAKMRQWNNFKRQEAGADWAFTIFVVNDLNDPDDRFHERGSFAQAFSYAGGLFMVVPASRPASTFAHEAGHMFWALDEYLDVDFDPITFQPTSLPDEYLRRRGYYNTQNTNAADNPAFSGPNPSAQQAPSIMGNNAILSQSYASHTLPASTQEMLGWRDEDGDGIFDVLDVPFSLTGTGRYDPASGTYRFTGSTSVRTLPNQNSYELSVGLKNDITINQIQAVQASINGGGWFTVQTFPARTYQTNLDLSIDLTTYPPGTHVIRLRSVDLRTGVTSKEFLGTTLVPALATPNPVGGFVFRDDDGDGLWDAGEPPLPDFGLQLLDSNLQPIQLQHSLEPDDYEPLTPLGQPPDVPGVALSVVGTDVVAGDAVLAIGSNRAPLAGNVFGGYLNSFGHIETWTTTSRRLKVEFDTPVGFVSMRAYKGTSSPSQPSLARMEAYDSSGKLLERFTTGTIPALDSRLLSISRPVADIKYIIVGGHAFTEVVLDDLAWGPAASTTTNNLGAYSLAGVPAGIYRVRANAPQGYIITTPVGGIATVAVASGFSTTNINFGIRLRPQGHNPYHNTILALNVSGDPENAISPLDALLVFNWLNANPNQSLLPPTNVTPAMGFVDVDNDGHCTPRDALLIINHLNGIPAGGGGESASLTPGAGTPPGGLVLGGGAAESEGETQVSVPHTAAEYFASQPVHIAFPEEAFVPCSCSRCLPIRDALLPEVAAETAPAAAPSALLLPLRPATAATLRSTSKLAIRTADATRVDAERAAQGARFRLTSFARSAKWLLPERTVPASGTPLADDLPLDLLAADAGRLPAGEGTASPLRERPSPAG